MADFPQPDPFAPLPDPGQELVPAPGGGLMIKDKDPYAQQPQFIPNPNGGPPIMLPPAPPTPANLPPVPGSVPTGTGPVPGIASTQNEPAPRTLPAYGPNAVLPDPTLATPPVPVAAPDLGAPAGIPPARIGSPGGGGHTSPPPAVPTGPTDLKQFEQAQQGQRTALQGTLDAEQRQREAEAGNEKTLSDFEVANNQERQRQANERQVSVDKAKKIADDDAQKVKNFKFTDWWESRSNGQKFLAGLGVILSGVSWEKNHVNGAMATIQQSIKDELALQKEKFQSAQYAATLSREGYHDADAMAQKAMVDFDRQSAVKLEGYKHQLASMLSNVKNETGLARGKELLAQLDAQAQTARQKFIEGQATLDKTRAETVTEQGKPALQRSQVAENYANASRLRAAGGAEGGIKNQKLLLQVSGQIQQQLAKDPEAKHNLESLAKYEDASAAIKSGEGLGSKLAIDEITKAATGLGARQGAIKVFQQATGGSFQQLLGGLKALKNGDSLTDPQKAGVEKFLDYTIADKRKKVGEVRDRIGAGMKRNPAYARNPEVIEGALDQHFGSKTPAAAAAGGGKWVTPKSGQYAGKQVLVDDAGNVQQVR